ncbi:Spy/CpxP family protein refolding chaperone [Pseudochelatococcus sp. B33]
MRKTLVAASAAAALLVGGIAPTFAQQDTQDKPAAERSEQDRQRGPRFSAEDRAAFTAARLAALKAGLQLTTEQETHWTALETALRSLSDERAEQRQERAQQRGERSRPDALEALSRQAEGLRGRADRLTTVAEAAKPLFDSLDDAQKRRFGILLRDNLAEGPHHWQRFAHGAGPHRGR